MEPIGEPQLERPTLHSLGVTWMVRGDLDRKASIRLESRKAGATPWRSGAPLFRVERGAHRRERFGSRLEVPEDSWLFSGSVLFLEPATSYEIRLTLVDPRARNTRGRAATTSRVLRAATRAEPRIPAGARRRHVVPGSGGGSGSQDDPYRGLAAAHSASIPGEVYLLHAGVYPGPWVIRHSGTPEKPIVWAAAGDGPAVIDGRGDSSQRPAHAIEASGAHDVWFEGLTVRNAMHGVTFHDAAHRRPALSHLAGRLRDECGAQHQGNAQDHFLADNVIEGPSTWPRTKGIEEARGIQITGEGHVICYNRIKGFADAIDTFPSPRCAGIDIQNNELSELTDDGIEMDYSERNNRCFFNRMTNVFQGISMQPVHGGPVYVFRNVMYNVAVEPFKLHNSPSGCLIFHNTSLKPGMPALLYTSEKVRNCWTRNNVFVGTTADYAFDCTAPMVDCDFDYDGFGGGPFRLFLRWNGVRYSTLDDVRKRAAGSEACDPGRFVEGIRVEVPAARRCRRRRRPTPSTYGSRLARRPSMPGSHCRASTMASEVRAGPRRLRAGRPTAAVRTARPSIGTGRKGLSVAAAADRRQLGEFFPVVALWTSVLPGVVNGRDSGIQRTRG